jgi:hypothetical protein
MCIATVMGMGIEIAFANKPFLEVKKSETPVGRFER